MKSLSPQQRKELYRRYKVSQKGPVRSRWNRFLKVNVHLMPDWSPKRFLVAFIEGGYAYLPANSQKLSAEEAYEYGQYSAADLRQYGSVNKELKALEKEYRNNPSKQAVGGLLLAGLFGYAFMKRPR